jgi:hypothetical protein
VSNIEEDIAHDIHFIPTVFLPFFFTGKLLQNNFGALAPGPTIRKQSSLATDGITLCYLVSLTCNCIEPITITRNLYFIAIRFPPLYFFELPAGILPYGKNA